MIDRAADRAAFVAQLNDGTDYDAEDARQRDEERRLAEADAVTDEMKAAICRAVGHVYETVHACRTCGVALSPTEGTT